MPNVVCAAPHLLSNPVGYSSFKNCKNTAVLFAHVFMLHRLSDFFAERCRWLM
jgi:hypothetical protein